MSRGVSHITSAALRAVRPSLGSRSIFRFFSIVSGLAGVSASRKSTRLGSWLAAGCFVLASPLGHAQDFKCENNCDLGRDKAYPNLIVGVVTGSANQEQSVRLFLAMRKARHWSAVPGDAVAFYRSVQPVSVRLPSGRVYTLLISREEANSAPLRAGDFVRYSPHRKFDEYPPPNDPTALAYWNIFGCIAVLCRAGDTACERGYRPGVYRATDGVALTADGQRVDSSAPSIDPDSMRPR